MTVFTKTVADTLYETKRDEFMGKLSYPEFTAVEIYTSSTYKEINKHMISGSAVENNYQSVIDALHSAIDKADDVNVTLPTVFRGTHQKFVEDFVEGEEVAFPFFLSVSTDPVVADRFAGSDAPAIIVINNLEKGYAWASLSLKESEVLVSPTNRFIVEKVTKGVDFQAEYEQSGFFAPVKKNVTVVEMTAI